MTGRKLRKRNNKLDLRALFPHSFRSLVSIYLFHTRDSERSVFLDRQSSLTTDTSRQQLGKDDDLDDESFQRGQKAESKHLGDPRDPARSSEPNWAPEFRQTIDFVILITGETKEHLAERMQEIERIFGIGTPNPSVKQVIAIQGSVRPGSEKGHEQCVLKLADSLNLTPLGSFGYRDGISQPGIRRFTELVPGQEAVPPGIALVRNPGDTKGFKRPSWSTDGSFLVFRYLQQFVPEFDDFLNRNPIVADGLPRNEGSELRG
jgi:deferrochelatase/peroxidase EfeB